MSQLVAGESLISVLGVVYVHKKTSDGGDIYLTSFGLPHEELLALENWYEPKWFKERRERLCGTSSVYKVPTKQVSGRSLELVVKNCRVGEDVPFETRTLIEFINAEFNSPWEEFALVMEMREGRFGSPSVRIATQEPLAIYVPPERMQIWQSGRSQSKINRIVARHPGIDLDILRQYKLIYGWIKGKNVVQVLEAVGQSGEDLNQALKPLSEKAMSDMEQKGFVVADMKPVHIIIGEEELKVVESAENGQAAAALLNNAVQQGRFSIVDYELLLRTPSYEEQVSLTRRHSYHEDQRDRFLTMPLPAHLRHTEVMGVPYVFGHAESTGGKLWVVGGNPRLFDYFLPERWRRTHAWKLSEQSEVFYTFTKDYVHIVWKTSRVGEAPECDDGSARSRAVRELGYNSPFEEFAIAHDLSNKGIPTVYIRAIYATGSVKLERSGDARRFESHASWVGPDGELILREDRNYITIRGYFNGLDSWVAKQRGHLCRPFDLEQAVGKQVLKQGEAQEIYAHTLKRLERAGYDGSLLEHNDILVALHPEGNLLQDENGRIHARICNLELIKRN
ncbi:MAG: hypothetical protein GX589_10255 [Deltaproteobacteria bacterium]|nr:hypothetical protein [Deltaproteobacteria bacterium]